MRGEQVDRLLVDIDRDQSFGAPSMSPPTARKAGRASMYSLNSRLRSRMTGERRICEPSASVGDEGLARCRRHALGIAGDGTRTRRYGREDATA
jgi:hypothetical protein